MKELTDLPIYDIWPLIFKILPIDDLFNCRLVSKKFKEFSEHTDGISKLIIGQPNPMFDNNYWYYDNKLIDDQDIISLECFRSIKLLSLFNLNRNLKYLKIYDQQFKLQELSNLINLESLELGYLSNDKKKIINLNNLKNFTCTGDLSVKLNTPKLEKIKFDEIKRITFVSNRDLIKHLITTNYDNKLEIFNNSEIIELRDTEQSINENLLIVFKNLKQLKINLSQFSKYSNEGINNSLVKILNDKMKLRKEINIYLEGVNVGNIDKFNELKANEDQYWKFRLNNYDQLDLNLSFIQNLYYKELVECVNNIENLPSDFFDKFQYINWVYVHGNENDIDSLNWFLNSLQYLTKLEIGFNKLLGQVFYNNLPNTIIHLNIYNNREDINYDFVLKLSKLIKFSTYFDNDLFDLAFTLFSNLKYLKEFKFYFKRNKIEIEKDGKYFYLNYCLRKQKLDYNQLIAKCNQIRRN